jgi:hypothetical protein
MLRLSWAVTIIIFLTNLLRNSPFFKAKALKTTHWKLEATISKSWNRAYKMYNTN